MVRREGGYQRLDESEDDKEQRACEGKGGVSTVTDSTLVTLPVSHSTLTLSSMVYGGG